MKADKGGIQFGSIIFHLVSLVNLWELGVFAFSENGLFVAAFVLLGFELFVCIFSPSSMSILLHLAGGLVMFIFVTCTISFPWFLTSFILFHLIPGILSLAHVVLWFTVHRTR